jgi:hypothetical protein
LGTPEPFEKFEEKMKQKWEALEHPAKPGAIDTLSEQEPLSSPPHFPLSEQHMLDQIEKSHSDPTKAPNDLADFMADTTAAPSDLALQAALADVKSTYAPAEASTPKPEDLDASLAALKAHLHAEADADDEAEGAEHDEAGVHDMLNDLHKHVHDLHSSVHTALDDSLNHPGIKPAVDSLELGKDDDGDDADAAVISAGDTPDADKISASDAPDADDEHMTNGPQKAMGDLLRGKADTEGGDSEGAPETKGVDSAEESTPDEGKVAAAPDADAGAAGEEADGNAMAGMKQLMGAVKMIVMLQPMLEPLKQKLEGALEHMAPDEAEKAKGILKHIMALDVYAKVTAGLMAGVVAAKKGTEADREKAVATLIVGVKQIQEKVAKHLVQMKQETKLMAAGAADAAGAAPEESDAPPAAGAAGKNVVAMDKMTALLVRLGQKIAREIKNPANKHNPKVLLDIKLFLAVKDAVEKTQGLMMAGSIAIKRAKTDEEKEAVQAAVKKGMSKVEATLKSKMLALEKQAIVLAVAAAKAKKHHDEEGESEDAGEDKPSHKSHGDDDEAKKDDDADTEDAEVKAPAPKKKKSAGKNKKVPPAEDAEDAGDEKEDAKAKDDDTDDDKDDAKDDEKAADAKADDDSKDDDADEAPAPAKKHPKKPAAEATEEADAPQDGSPKDSAKNNHPEISAADIDSIFAEAGPDPKDAAADAAEEEVPHLRTH